MEKRGQITIFIILGLILLISTAIIIYLQTTKHKAEIETGKRTVIAKAPVEMQPLNKFITDCIAKTGEEGVRKLGMQGGYIDLKKAGISSGAEPTTGKALKFYPDNNFEIPYWWHLSSPNKCSGTCEFDTERPALLGPYNSIQSQLEEYLTQNLKNCLKGFSDFKEQGYSFEEKGNTTAKVIITPKDIIIDMEYPLEIKKGGETYKLERYTNDLPVRLVTIYSIGSKVANAEINFSFLEKEMKNIISIYSGVDSNKLPPISDSTIGPFNFVFWTKSKLKEQVKDILSSFIPLFQIPGTQNYQARDQGNIFTQGIYKLSDLAIPADYPEEFQNISVKFVYLDWWDIYLDISGRGAKGEVIMPEFVMNTGLLPFGIARYTYYYDISFPVMVEIYDHEAFDGRGYRFMMALEGNLRDNGYLNTSYKDLSYDAQETGSLFCNYGFRNSGNITIETDNKITKEPLDEVGVVYRCGEDSCAIGFTEMTKGQAEIRQAFPICLGGTVEANKIGYWSRPERLTTEEGESDEVRMELVPIREINFSILKKPVEKYGNAWTFIDTPRRLYANEEAFVQLDRIKEDPLEEDFSSAGVFYGNQTGAGTIRLIPGKYEVDITLVYRLPAGGQRAVIIPEEEKCEGGSLVTKCKKITLPQIEFNDTFPEGGSHMGPIYNTTFINGTSNYTEVKVDETGLWEVKAEDLYNSNAVQFFAIASPGSGVKENTLTYDDMDTLNQKEALSKEHRDSIEPRFIKK